MDIKDVADVALSGYRGFSEDAGVSIMETLVELAIQLLQADSAEDKVQILDKMFNVYHANGDLSKNFVKDGSKFFSQLSSIEGVHGVTDEAKGLIRKYLRMVSVEGDRCPDMSTHDKRF